MRRDIYRKEALERLSSPEQLDVLMPITNARGWIALTGIGLVLLVGLLWGIFGTVVTTVDGSGLLMRQAGFRWVASPQAGRVADILADADDTVEKGSVLLTIFTSGRDGSGELIPVRSPQAGRVLNVTVWPGSAVEQGTTLVSIEAPDEPLKAVVYVAADDGFRVRPGMDVRVRPATARQEGAIALSGTVRRAARFPATYQEMMYSLQNEEWVTRLLGLGPTLEIVIDLSSHPDRDDLYSGTPCEASITIDRRRPLAFLLPVVDIE